jgi:CBS domain-containing protein
MSTATRSFRTPRLSMARVADAMHPGVLSCSPDTPLREAARMMALHRVHCLVLGDPPAMGARPTWRLLSDRDVVAATLETDIDDRTAGECATRPAVTVGADEPLVTAARLMVDHGIAHVLVLGSASGRPAGVLSSLDIAGLAAWGED